MDPELDSLVRDFVGRLQAHFRKQTLAAVNDFIGAVGVRPPAATTSATKATTSRTTKPTPARSVLRRSDSEIAKTVQKVTQYVTAHPGSRMEQIGAGLRLRTKDLTRPVAKLLTGGVIRREGEKRATRYFPASGEAASPPAPNAASTTKSAAKGKKASKAAPSTA